MCQVAIQISCLRLTVAQMHDDDYLGRLTTTRMTGS
jgi:hypothetical protein